MIDLGNAYAGTKKIMLPTIGGVDDAWSVPVAATPDRDVTDVVRNVTGLCVEAAGGGLMAGQSCRCGDS